MFHPTGVSSRVSLASQAPQVIALQSLTGTKKALRIVAVTYPSAGVCFCNLGADSITVNSGNGMPIDLSGGKEQFIAVDAETHLALLMSTNSNYEVIVTPGEIV